MNVLSIFDADQWRAVIRDFDAKRAEFGRTLATLRNTRGATPSLEARRAALISGASAVQAGIDRLYGALTTVRNWLASLGKSFGGGLSGLGLAPLVIGIGVSGVVLVVNQIVDWLKLAAKFNSDNRYAETLAKAGADAKTIANAVDSRAAQTKEQLKFLGLDSGAIPWIVGGLALVLAGPTILKALQKRGVL